MFRHFLLLALRALVGGRREPQKETTRSQPGVYVDVVSVHDPKGDGNGPEEPAGPDLSSPRTISRKRSVTAFLDP